MAQAWAYVPGGGFWEVLDARDVDADPRRCGTSVCGPRPSAVSLELYAHVDGDMPAQEPWSDAMRRSQLTRVLALATLAAVFTAGCTGGNPKPTASTTPTATTSSASPTAQATPTTMAPSPTASATAAPTSPLPATEPAKAPPFPADTAPDTSAASAGAFLSPVNLRFGVHDGYDRVVLDLEGTGQPGWVSQYVTEPRAEGSGSVISLAGAAYLQTTVKGVTYPTEPGAKPYIGPQRFSPASAGIVKEVVYGDVFEGQAEVYIGLGSKQPFRVFLLENPTRIVIDIYQP